MIIGITKIPLIGQFEYYIPRETLPALYQTTLALEFNFVGDSRTIRVGYSPPEGRWYAVIPGDLDLSKTVDMTDLAMFAECWRRSDCNEPDWCSRADIDRSGEVGWADAQIFTEYWLYGLTP